MSSRPFFPVDVVTRHRKDNERGMPDTVDILRKTIVISDMGEQLVTWPVVATVPCRVRSVPRMLPETIIGGQMTSGTSYTFHVPITTVVTPKDNLVHDGGRLNIARIFKPTTAYLTSIRISAEEVN